MKPLFKTILVSVVAMLAMPSLAQDTAMGVPLREVCHVDGAKELQTRVAEHTKSEREIMDLERLSCRMLGNIKTIDKVMEIIIAKDGRVLLDGAGIADSRKEQAQLFKEYFKAGYNIVYEPFEARVSKSGDMAWAIGLIKETKPNGAIEIGKYVSIWHRIDGVWKNVIEMRNSDGGVPLTK